MYVRPRGRIDSRVRARAKELLAEGLLPSAVAEALGRDFPQPGPRLPTLRWIKAERSKHLKAPSEPWSFADAKAEQARQVLPVLAVVIERTQGRRQGLTNAEADEVAHVTGSCPGIDPWSAYLLAHQLVVATEEEAQAITHYLAFAALAEDAGTRYRRAATKGWIEAELMDSRYAPEEGLYRYETPGEAVGAGPDAGEEARE